ncbi:uncharacterized protein K02A2.6 [Trichonephila clavipes]|nr:uncharacterized protein K02A2.6 [Trichonephila clavipes]
MDSGKRGLSSITGVLRQLKVPRSEDIFIMTRISDTNLRPSPGDDLSNKHMMGISIAETSKQQVETVTPAVPKVHEVRKNKPKPFKKQNQSRDVFKCDTEHSTNNCPAWGKLSAKNENENYFAAVCGKSKQNRLYLSPARLLFGCRLRTKLPIHSKLLNSELFTDLTENIVKRQKPQKLYYDKGSTNLGQFHSGDDVTMYDFSTKTWTPAKVISRSENSQSYIVQNSTGKTFLRSRGHWRASNILR